MTQEKCFTHLTRENKEYVKAIENIYAVYNMLYNNLSFHLPMSSCSTDLV